MASAGTRIGPWVVVRRIAIGGMAEIFEAHEADAPDAAPVVLKVLLPQHLKDPEFVRMLGDEARLHAALVHPNLVRLLRHDVAAAPPWLALELVDGTTLADLDETLRAQGRAIPREVALHVI